MATAANKLDTPKGRIFHEADIRVIVTTHHYVVQPLQLHDTWTQT
jgi:hypothetical protein